MKKFILLIIMIFLLSGCSMVDINKQSYEEIVNSILSEETNLKTVSLEGYSYFLPQGVSLNKSNNFNSVLYYNHKKMYLYTDLISYYHKSNNNYKIDNNKYYSLVINNGDNKGYLEITQTDNDYYVEYMYRYSKIEAYVSEKDLKKTITVMSYILNSIKINEPALESLIGNNVLNYSEEEFNIYKQSGTTSDYLDILEEHDDGRLSGKDEDILELDENIE